MSTQFAEAPATRFTSEPFPVLIFFDGECAFCDGWVIAIKDADSSRRHIRFAPKQGSTFAAVKEAHPELADVDSIVVAVHQPDGSERYLIRSAAVREIVRGLRGFSFGLSSWVLSITPRFLADIGYRIFARFRIAIFGKIKACRVPSPEDRELFLD